MATFIQGWILSGKLSPNKLRFECADSIVLQGEWTMESRLDKEVDPRLELIR